MGRRASPWRAILTGPEQVLGACWLSLFRAELDVNDPCFPLVACAHIDKRA
jgi:hypothetical protein